VLILSGDFSEMFHADRWHSDVQFYSPMVCLYNGVHVFIGDCINYQHQDLGTVCCMVIKFFEMVWI
jgi:hypothetical protein